MISYVFLLNFLCFYMVFGQTCGKLSSTKRYTTCPIHLTVTIDFSKSMQTYENIEYHIDFLLSNFTNGLPFNESNFNIALLTFGTINGSKIFGPYDSYEKFCAIVNEQYGISKKYGMFDQDVNETLTIYSNYISTSNPDDLKCAEDIPCTHKMVFFTSTNNLTNLQQASQLGLELWKKSFTIAVGLNQTYPAYKQLFDIGQRIFLVNFRDYFSWKELPFVEYLQDVLCSTNIKGPKQHKCGDGFCDSILCGQYEQKTHCQYFAKCLLNKCYYWRHSVMGFTTAEGYCGAIDASLPTITDQDTQDEIYKTIGDFEYWIGLSSKFEYYFDGGYNASLWKWQNPDISLSETNYSNWAPNQPDTQNGKRLCVSDTNSSVIDVKHWKALPCSDNDNRRLFMCVRGPTIESMSTKSWVLIAILVPSLIIFILAIISFLFYRRHQKIKLARNQRTGRDERHSGSSNHTLGTLVSNLELSIPHLHLKDSDDAMFSRIFGLMPFINKLSFPGHETTYDFKYDDLENLGLLEATSLHQVGKFHHRPSKVNIVIKFLIIPYSCIDDGKTRMHYKKLLREIENFKTLWECPNIVNFYGLCVHEMHALLCMEMMDMSLRQLYGLVHKKTNLRFPEEIIGYIFVKIVDAIMYCNSKGIMHRDIKPANILSNYSGEIKLCDFGESRIMDNSLASTYVGTTSYWPPERFNACPFKYDIRADVWSLGITLMEMILGRLPYELPDECHDSILQFAIIANTNFEAIINDEVQNSYSEDLCELLKSCTNEIEGRPRLYELTNTKFYEDYKNVDQKTMENFLSVVKTV